MRLGVFVLVVLLGASPVVAQERGGGADAEGEAEAESEAEAEAEAEAESDGGAESGRPSAAASAEANERVVRGEALYGEGDYDAALAEFERAHELMAGHPHRHLILYNIARAHQRRFRYDLALDYYRRYLSFGGPGLPHREAATAALESLGSLLATVIVQVNVPAEVWIEGRQVGDAPGQLVVPGGRHVLELRAAGYEAARTEIQIPPGTESAVELTLDPLAESFRGLDPSFCATSLIAASVAALIGAGLGIAVVVERAEVDRALDDPVERNSVGATAVEEIQRLALGADVSFAVAGLGVVLGVVFALLTDWDGEEESVEAQVVPGGAGLVGRW